MHNKTSFVRALFLLCALISSFLPSPSHTAHAQPATRHINAFDISGRFLDQWSKPGSDRDSFYVNGLPITSRRPEISVTDGKTYDTQWFERASYEYHPDLPAPYDVQLGLLGSRLAEGRGAVDPSNGQLRDNADAPFLSVAQPSPDTGSGTLWFPETRHTLSGKFRDTWNRFGGLQQFGFPISEPFTEQSATDGKLYTVQYFERNRFELHPDDPAPYDVQLGLLGSQQFRLYAMPAADLPIAPPTGVTSAHDTYTEGSLQEPDTMFCNEANTVVAVRFCAAVTFNDSMIGMDNKGDYFPLAAWYIPTIENGGSFFVGTGDDRHLITKYKLRPGIKWSDGIEITSNDAVFSYKLKLDDPLTMDNSLQRKLASVDNPDKYTVIYRWLSFNQARTILADPKTDKTAYAFLNPFIDLHRPIVDSAYLETGTIHPQHILQPIMEKRGADRIQESSEGTKPTGYGPYIVQEWKMGDKMTLTRNENYNLTAKPLIGKIVSIFDTNVNTNVYRFVGDYGLTPIDGIAREGFVVPPEQTDDIKKAGGIVAATPSSTWEHADPKFTFPPFQDIRVRQAMLYAINRQQIIDVVYKGAGALQSGPVPASIYHSLENPDFATNFPELAAKYQLRTYTYNPTLANQLLDEAGWKLPCGDPTKCVREKDGVKISFDYATRRNAVRFAIQTLVANDFKKVGIEALVINYPVGCWECDPGYFTYRASLIEDASTANYTNHFDRWDSSDFYNPDTYIGVNIQHYSNPKVDAANRLFKTSLDRATLAEQSAIIQVELMNDAAIIPLVQRANIEIYTSKLQNRKPPNSTVPAWWNIGQWYFLP